MLRFAILFPLIVLVLFALYLLKPVEVAVIDPFTSLLAQVSTAIIDIFDDDAITYGKIIQSTHTGFAVSIERGCNGLEAVIILVAALLAFPAPWKHRIVGLVIGFLAIQGLNLVRIISLFYMGEYETAQCVAGEACHTPWFDWFHHYLWQALIIIDALVVWLIWLRYLPRPAARAAAASPA
jgi:exosortase H (IPTLxxWG-CTERM-specific)